MLKHERYFKKFRKETIGNDLLSPQGKRVIYTDWTASGRLYRPIENFITESLGPYVANTHSESNLTGGTTTQTYDEAKDVIRQHVNANKDDILMFGGSGMTAMINKLQRILGLKDTKRQIDAKPLVLITHMEHHSNQVSWLECYADVEIIPANESGLPCLISMRKLLENYEDRPIKIGSFTACSNVTGVITPYHEMAKIMHYFGGVCFVDFAASAPYVDIDMHPSDDSDAYLDGVFISPHKFLGGPGSSGLMILNKSLYSQEAPDQPGGGTVAWTNPWGRHKFVDDIEAREDGGTPGFIQVIRTALAIKLKDAMSVEKMTERKKSINEYIYYRLSKIENLRVLEPEAQQRQCILSFYIVGLHHNLVVKLLNDRYAIQARGGCSCAGTYGHYLLDIDKDTSLRITQKIDQGDLMAKPGWVRISFHPINTDKEVKKVVDAIETIARKGKEFGLAYVFNPKTAEFVSMQDPEKIKLITHFSALPSLKAFGSFSRLFLSGQ